VVLLGRSFQHKIRVLSGLNPLLVRRFDGMLLLAEKHFSRLCCRHLAMLTLLVLMLSSAVSALRSEGLFACVRVSLIPGQGFQ
jgi:hypothetical protein